MTSIGLLSHPDRRRRRRRRLPPGHRCLISGNSWTVQESFDSKFLFGATLMGIVFFAWKDAFLRSTAQNHCKIFILLWLIDRYL